MSAYSKSQRCRRKKKLIKPLVASAQKEQPAAGQQRPTAGVNQPQTGINRIATMHNQMSGTQHVASHFRTTSLKELAKEKAVQTSINVSQLKDASNEFTQDDLLRSWMDYTSKLTSDKIHLKNTLNSCKPVLKADFTFEVAVYNPSQKDEVLENSDSILGYLSNKLNNNRLKMDIRIVEKDEVEMIYTSVEKYSYLSKKNPNIEKLMDIFNLVMD